MGTLAACADGLAACADLAVDVSGTLAPAAFVLDAALDLPKRLTRWILYRLRNSLTCSLVRLQCALCACKRPSGLEKKKKSSCVSQRLFRLFSAFLSFRTNEIVFLDKGIGHLHGAQGLRELNV